MKVQATPAAAHTKTDSSFTLFTMKKAFSIDGEPSTKQAVDTDLSKLPKALAKKLVAERIKLEDFVAAHGDEGGIPSGVMTIFSGPDATTVLGYAAYAHGSDDMEYFHSDAVTYFSASGRILDRQKRSDGVSANDESGNWDGIDSDKLEANQKVLARAVSIDMTEQTLNIAKSGVTETTIDKVPSAFRALVKATQKELQATAWEGADMGCAGGAIYAVKNDRGQPAGFAVVAFGSDDADGWKGAAMALFNIDGQLLDRQMSSGGFADNMTA